jgi:crossover junction endodeoxyribonuclease RuvC
MRVLGIDPGTVRMGYGLVVSQNDQAVAADWGVVGLPPSRPIEERLFQLYSHVMNMISIWQPDAIAVEEPFLGRGENQYVTSALAIGQAQALVLIAAAGQAIPVSRYSPTQVKRAIADYGAATKEQVQEMVKMLLGLDSVPSSSDAADALAIALCHLRQRQMEDVLSREIIPGS